MVIRARRDGAAIVVNGRRVGSAHWSLSDEPEIIISGEAADVIPLGHGFAAMLNAEFEELKE
jgi:hypothetical protein